MTPTAGPIMCRVCGYDLSAAPDGAGPCPECGEADARSPLRPWPSPLLTAWHLARVQLISAAVVGLLLLASVTADRAGVPMAAGIFGGMAAVGGLIAAGLLLFWPISQAELATSHHCPERGRAKVWLMLLALGWVASLGVVLLLLTCAALLVNLGA